MRTDQFDYDLPAELIAQEPCPQRDQARLLVVRRADAAFSHHRFRDLPELLAAGDLLVLNDTRVIPARLLGRRLRTGGRWQGLFLHASPRGEWEILSQTRGRLHQGETIQVEPGPLRLFLLSKTPLGHWLVRPSESGEPVALLERFGRAPIPPYIRKGLAADSDRGRYQTVYANKAGAVAAPTAGLHFTQELFARLEQRGIGRSFVTLHVGLGTFQPIQTDEISQHHMHREWGSLPHQTVGEIKACRERGGRVVNGRGADTDIVVASAKAYINAINKAVSPVERAHPQV